MLDIPPALQRVAGYGDGLFETMLAVDGTVPLLAWHRARLERAVAALDATADLDFATLWRDLAARVVSHSGIVKLSCFRSGGLRGYRAQQTHWQYSLHCAPPPVYPQHRIQSGIRLQIVPERLGFQAALAGMKHCNRLSQVLAADQLDRTLAEDGLLLSDDGWVLESIIGNIVAVERGQLLTPALHGNGVCGVMRGFLMEQAPQLGLQVRECPLTVDRLLVAEGVWVVNSVFGVWPVRAIGVVSLPVNAALTQAWWQLLAPLGYLSLYE